MWYFTFYIFRQMKMNREGGYLLIYFINKKKQKPLKYKIWNMSKIIHSLSSSLQIHFDVENLNNWHRNETWNSQVVDYIHKVGFMICIIKCKNSIWKYLIFKIWL
jgi:hypothetical protein